jgi:hypothetical protein
MAGKTYVGVAVGVQVGVEVKNNVRVGVGEVEVVRVSAMEVGEVPNSACEVSAIAVLVLLAFRSSDSLAGPPEAIQTASSRTTNMPETPSACK